MLLACSKSDTQTLSCYGTLLASIANNQPGVSKITRTYKVDNSKFSEYECITKNYVISCDFVKDENRTREYKRIIYDTKSLSFVETDVVLDLAKIHSPKENLISKSEFVGTCQKQIFN
jgi:hypothetical protein